MRRTCVYIGRAIFIAALLAAGCSSPDTKRKEAQDFYRSLADISREIHDGSKYLHEMTKFISDTVEQGKPINKEAVEQVVRERLSALRELRIRVAALRPPQGTTAQTLHEAMKTGLEGEQKRLTDGFREWLNVYEDSKLTLAEKQERGKTISERLAADRNKDEAAIKEARQAFAKEFHITQ